MCWGISRISRLDDAMKDAVVLGVVVACILAISTAVILAGLGLVYYVSLDEAPAEETTTTLPATTTTFATTTTSSTLPLVVPDNLECIKYSILSGSIVCIEYVPKTTTTSSSTTTSTIRISVASGWLYNGGDLDTDGLGLFYINKSVGVRFKTVDGSGKWSDMTTYQMIPIELSEARYFLTHPDYFADAEGVYRLVGNDTFIGVDEI